MFENRMFRVKDQRCVRYSFVKRGLKVWNIVNSGRSSCGEFTSVTFFVTRNSKRKERNGSKVRNDHSFLCTVAAIIKSQKEEHQMKTDSVSL